MKHFTQKVKRNDRKCKQSDFSEHFPWQSTGTKHRATKENEGDLHDGYQYHDQQKTFVFLNMRKKFDTARSGVECIANSAKHKQTKK